MDASRISPVLRSVTETVCEEFSVGRNGRIFQRDHYVALFAGGETSLKNTVLACKLCNTRKGTTHGTEFSRLSARNRRDAIKSRYNAMRRQFRIGLIKYFRDRQKALEEL